MHVITNLSADSSGVGICKKINMQRRSFFSVGGCSGVSPKLGFLGGRIFGKMKKMPLDLIFNGPAVAALQKMKTFDPFPKIVLPE